jgi:protein TonB
VITEAKPRYTEAAMRARIQGIVEMQVVVLADGTVGPVRVVRSLDKELGLDEQAVRAVKEWTFKPGRKDDKPVNVLVNIEMTFKVRDGR